MPITARMVLSFSFLCHFYCFSIFPAHFIFIALYFIFRFIRLLLAERDLTAYLYSSYSDSFLNPHFRAASPQKSNGKSSQAISGDTLVSTLWFDSVLHCCRSSFPSIPPPAVHQCNRLSGSRNCPESDGYSFPPNPSYETSVFYLR